MIRNLALASLASLVLGSVAGLLVPGPQDAQAVTINLELRVNPGPAASTDTLNCGWHDVCQTPYDRGLGNNALDWQNTGGSTVYWRSYGYRSDASTNNIASGKVLIADTPTCRRILVEVKDAFGASLGLVYYTHTATNINGATFNIGGKQAWQATWAAIGTSANAIGGSNPAEFAGCPFTAPHLHQYSSSSFAKNSSLYPNAPSGGSYNVTLLASYQQQRTWYWVF